MKIELLNSDYIAELPDSFMQWNAINKLCSDKTHIWYENPYKVIKFKVPRTLGGIKFLVRNLLSCEQIQIDKLSRDNLAKYLQE